MPTSLDFSKAPEPSEKLRSATLIEGEGATVEKGQALVVNYLGQVYDGKEPFDESYSSGSRRRSRSASARSSPAGTRPSSAPRSAAG